MSIKAKLGEFMKMLTEMSFQLLFKKGHRFGRSVGLGNGLEMWAANRYRFLSSSLISISPSHSFPSGADRVMSCTLSHCPMMQ